MITFTLRQNHRAEDMSPHPLLLALEAASLMDSDSIRWALWRNTPNWCMIQWVSSGIDSNTSPWWLPKDCFFLMLLIDVNWIKSIIFFSLKLFDFWAAIALLQTDNYGPWKLFEDGWKWLVYWQPMHLDAIFVEHYVPLFRYKFLFFFSSCDSYIMSTKS